MCCLPRPRRVPKAQRKKDLLRAASETPAPCSHQTVTLSHGGQTPALQLRDSQTACDGFRSPGRKSKGVVSLHHSPCRLTDLQVKRRALRLPHVPSGGPPISSIGFAYTRGSVGEGLLIYRATADRRGSGQKVAPPLVRGSLRRSASPCRPATCVESSVGYHARDRIQPHANSRAKPDRSHSPLTHIRLSRDARLASPRRRSTSSEPRSKRAVNKLETASQERTIGVRSRSKQVRNRSRPKSFFSRRHNGLGLKQASNERKTSPCGVDESYALR